MRHRYRIKWQLSEIIARKKDPIYSVRASVRFPMRSKKEPVIENDRITLTVFPRNRDFVAATSIMQIESMLFSTLLSGHLSAKTIVQWFLLAHVPPDLPEVFRRSSRQHEVWPPIEFGRNHEETDVPEKLERWRAACDSRSPLRDTPAVSVLPPSVARAKWRRYWPARVPHHRNTSWTPCCCKIYGPYHGAASKRLFAVKRKRLIKTSLHNRVNIGSMFGQDKFIDPLKTILYRRTDQ